MLKTLPAISVCIPCYNVEKTIVSSLGSIVNQNYPKNKIVVLLCDNNSTDKGIEIAKKYLQKNKMNFKILSEKAKGQPFARWTLWHNVRTPYFVFLDGDDWYLPNAFKDLVGGLKKDIDMVLGGGAYVLERWMFWKSTPFFNKKYNYTLSVVWSILFKTSYVKQALSKQKYSDLHCTQIMEEIYFYAYICVHQPRVIRIENKVYVYNKTIDKSVSKVKDNCIEFMNNFVYAFKYLMSVVKESKNPKLIKSIKKNCREKARGVLKFYLKNKKRERKIYKKMYADILK